MDRYTRARDKADKEPEARAYVESLLQAIENCDNYAESQDLEMALDNYLEGN